MAATSGLVIEFAPSSVRKDELSMTLPNQEREPLFARAVREQLLESLQASDQYSDARLGQQYQRRADILGPLRLGWDRGLQIRERYGSFHTSPSGDTTICARSPGFAEAVYGAFATAEKLTGGQPPDVQDEWLYVEFQEKGMITEESQGKHQELQKQRLAEARTRREQNE